MDHLPDETKQQVRQYDKPIIVSSKTLPTTVGMLHQVLVESVNLDEMRKLYFSLLTPTDEKYKDFKSIKLYEGLLQKIIKSGDQIREIIAPLYLLNDLRTIYDHLIPNKNVAECKKNVVDSLELSSFDESAIYEALLKRLSVFYKYLLLGYSQAS